MDSYDSFRMYMVRRRRRFLMVLSMIILLAGFILQFVKNQLRLTEPIYDFYSTTAYANQE